MTGPEVTGVTAGAADRELLPIATGRQTLAALGALLRPRRGLAVAALVTLVSATAVSLLTAPLLGRIVDLAVAKAPAAAITTPALQLAAVAVVAGLLTILGIALVAKLGEGMLAELRERFVERALKLPLEQVEGAGSGDLTARVTRDVTMIGEAIRDGLPSVSRAVLSIVLTLGAMAILDWRFLLVALLAVPIQVYTARWYVRSALPLYARHRAAVGVQQQQLLDTLGGADTVRAFRLDADHLRRVEVRSSAAVDLVLRAIRLMTRFYARLNLAEFVGLAAVLVAGFVLVRNGDASIGTATASALYFHNLFGPINVALISIDEALSASASLSRLVGVAQLAAPEAPARPAAARNGTVDGSVKGTDLWHEYRPGQPVLRGVDLEVGPGEQVALVGASGAGKTTLAKLVAGVHRPSGGTILLGGIPAEELGPPDEHRTVALVTQEVYVFSGPLADDLRLARPGATDAELTDALERVGALGWAEALPDGLRTEVGEGAHRLTVTQAQQLALARLVLADPPVAILDEATAEAGSAGARELEASAAAALRGRTALIVAHRLSQAVSADRVIVMDAGRVVESGTHAELLAAGGRYAEFWSAWSDFRQS